MSQENRTKTWIWLLPAALIAAVVAALFLTAPDKSASDLPDQQPSEDGRDGKHTRRYARGDDAQHGFDEESAGSDSLFVFDPNEVTYEELRALGFSKRTAVGIVKYRAHGKVFAIPEDFALCYGVTDSMYVRLKPYIKIDSSYAPKNLFDKNADGQQQAEPTIVYQKFRIDTVSYKYLRTIGFSTRQARAVVEYRERGNGIRDMDELRDCYAVSPEKADTLQYYVIFPDVDPYDGLVEINAADSATLRSVSGIGAKTVVAVMQYRRLLGGYYSIDQIAELKCVTRENFDKISKQIYCDSSKISKIDINFAPACELEHHPYITSKTLRKILKFRETKGGWTTIEEMISDEILSREEAEILAPYLRFNSTFESAD